jgi:hypothetical protein
MTLLLGEGSWITGKGFWRKTRNEPSKKKKRRQGKKEAEGARCTGQITLDSESILANMQNRVHVRSLAFPSIEPKSLEGEYARQLAERLVPLIQESSLVSSPAESRVQLPPGGSHDSVGLPDWIPGPSNAENEISGGEMT